MYGLYPISIKHTNVKARTVTAFDTNKNYNKELTQIFYIDLNERLMYKQSDNDSFHIGDARGISHLYVHGERLYASDNNNVLYYSDDIIPRVINELGVCDSGFMSINNSCIMLVSNHDKLRDAKEVCAAVDGVLWKRASRPQKNCQMKYTSAFVPDYNFEFSSDFYGYSFKTAYLDSADGWSAKTNSIGQWIGIDLKKTVIVYGFVTQGRATIAQFVTSFKFSCDGNTVKKNNVDMIFPGNSDSNSKVVNYLPVSLPCQRAHVLPQTYNWWMSLRMELIHADCPMENVHGSSHLGTNCELKYTSALVYDYTVSVSSDYSLNSHEGLYLDSTDGWASLSRDVGQWVEIDLKRTTMVHGIVTQGRAMYDQHVTSFKFACDGIYVKDNNVDKVFLGNFDRNTKVVNFLPASLSCRTARVFPLTFHSWMSMRMEFIHGECSVNNFPDDHTYASSKIPVTCEARLASELYPGFLISASEDYINANGASARLDEWGWALKYNHSGAWIEFDFELTVVVLGIVTIGRAGGYQQWVTTYKASCDGNSIFENGQEKVYQGNTDKITKVVNYLSEPLYCQKFRVYPLTGHGWMTMRLGFMLEDCKNSAGGEWFHFGGKYEYYVSSDMTCKELEATKVEINSKQKAIEISSMLKQLIEKYPGDFIWSKVHKTRHTSDYIFEIGPGWWTDLGCWKDVQNDRAIPSADANLITDSGNPKLRKDAIRLCAEYADSMGFSVFALQDGGSCFTGVNAHTTYNKHGESSECKNDGEGGYLANQVYKIRENWHTLGCWVDFNTDRAISPMDFNFGDVYDTGVDAIKNCAKYAFDQGYSVFAMQNGGECWTSANAETSYKKHGPSTHCQSDGLGGVLANQVYRFADNCCNIPIGDRINCGFSGVTKAKSHAMGCCFSDSLSYLPRETCWSDFNLLANTTIVGRNGTQYKRTEKGLKSRCLAIVFNPILGVHFAHKTYDCALKYPVICERGMYNV
ncbi:uncharacterized protein LOC120347843 [Styela clava]